jgi:quinol-cytochrome oxidoreductase complex cytochrome b subunit
MSGEAWFRPKTVGYGNVPSNWKGWAVTIAFMLFVIGMVALDYAGAISKFWTVAVVLAATAVYLPFIKAKTSGEWRWRSRAGRE